MGNIIFLFKAFAGSFKWFNVFVFQDEHPENLRGNSLHGLFSQFPLGCCIDCCCSCWCCCCCWLWDGFSQWKKARMCVFFVGVVTIRFVFFCFVSYKAGLYSLRTSRLQPKIHFDLIWFKYYELLNWFYFVLVFFLFFLCFFFFVFLLIVV